MKRLLIFLLFMQPALALTLSAKTSSSTVSMNDNVQLSITLSVNNIENVTVNYTVFKGTKINYTSSETKRVMGSLTYLSFFKAPQGAGNYVINITASDQNSTAKFSVPIKIYSDCVKFSGNTDAYALKNQTQNYEISLINSCDFVIHNVNISLLNSYTIIPAVYYSATANLTNVTAPKTSQNVRISAVYDEGVSNGIIDFTIENQAAINTIVGGLVNSTLVMYNKTASNINIAVIGKTSSLMQDYNNAVFLMNSGIKEASDLEYTMAISHLSKSIESFRKANDAASGAVTTEILLILIVGIILISIATIVLYNKYKDIIKEKGLEELGKS